MKLRYNQYSRLWVNYHPVQFLSYLKFYIIHELTFLLGIFIYFSVGGKVVYIDSIVDSNF